jgi:SpoVK/Ycf46/Vps4 family AAA+-type ATPase
MSGLLDGPALPRVDTSLVGLQRAGVTVTGALPDPDWADRWDRIVVEPALKQKLLSYCVFCLTQRSGTSMVGMPAHGLTLLSGPPGTGKTTLAHGLANETARFLRARGAADRVLFATVDPHSFPSEFLGESQRAVGKLFNETLPELAAQGQPLIVLLDEVESLAVSRSLASFDTNPVDVHRATNAVLTGIDALASQFSNVVCIATTNEASAIDSAFLSRVDVHVAFALPDESAAAEILTSTLAELQLDTDEFSGAVPGLAARCVTAGLDARQIRKLVLEAMVSNGPELALTPRSLRPEHLRSVLAEPAG